MLKFFSIKDIAMVVAITIVSHAIGMYLLHELIGVGSLVSSLVSSVGTVFALYKLNRYMDFNLEVKPKKRPL